MTDVVGDQDIKVDMHDHAAVERKVKLMTETKLKVVKQVKKYDESEQIFAKKKGKEREAFLKRNAMPAYSPDKQEKGKPKKSYQVKENIDSKVIKEEKAGNRHDEFDVTMPQYVF